MTTTEEIKTLAARMVAREPGEDGIPVSRLHKVISEMDGPSWS